ncbi:1,4-alpha-glucan branching protein GlgB [Anaeromyxobacter sp. Fw109-5]|uniref:1,4-alpha-glucan branching protein GlgB n=1 Tax=Anaeromyxobacter sp. (strain Fw109-5) TaxID=404589 RepID=UPI0000ED8AFD|nr:1,4-alpha-glucan branching protein GlgB [Anaeromyxobacter sp. Fw109-5]ABS27266.1 1,4-alpha-glucan branching enzyme [Anaeromyxobacter sp. Fw109-5]
MDASLSRLTTTGPWDELLHGPGRAGLEAALPPYLVGRRWFGGKARRIQRVELLDAAPVGPGPGASRLVFLRVSYGDSAPEVYSLPLAFAPGPWADRVHGAWPGSEVALLEAGGEQGVLYATDRDPAFSRALLDAIAHGRTLKGRGGEIVAWSTRAFARRSEGVEELVPTPLGGEQSNTSIRFGDRMILKLFRRTEAGPNPELEVGAYLTERAAFPNVPAVLGAVEYRPRGGEPHVLALLQAFVPNRGDAWEFTLAELSAFLDRAAGRAPPAAPAAALVELAGVAPPPELRALAAPSLDAAALLGRRTAELHLALARGVDEEAFRPEPFSREDRRRLHDGARAQVRAALALLRRRRDVLPPEVRARAEAVLAREDELELGLRWVLDRPLTALRTRTHGDFHLGQVLRTGGDYVVIDFEGEPARPMAERRAKASPLRDVAGMVRSLHYAAHAGPARRAERPDAAPGEAAHAQAWARVWYAWVAASFLRAYLDAARGARFLPAGGELRELLALYLTEKALYELAYELNNRPDWVRLPLEGIAELLGAAEAGAREREDALPTKGTREAPRAAAREAREGGAPGAVLARGGPGELDRHLWNEGTNHRAYRTLGAHPQTIDGAAGTSFTVWAPNAERVSVIGDFNGWDKERHPLRRIDDSGLWQGFLPGVGKGAVYKYHLRSRERGYAVDKADPFGFMHETAPGTQSIVWDLAYAWGDDAWMRARRERNGLASPMSVYEVHLGSWRRVPEEGNRPLTYRELAPLLADHVAALGFTHVELLPVTEHPFYGSWGYQTTGYFAPTSRYGTPQDFMFLVDTLHQRGIGVILDWVPSHFPTDEHGLAYFDGTHLFEHADRRQGHHPDWDSFIFNYGRNEVRSFLLSSALFWLDAYHADGLRVDAVASMLYLDYSRKHGEWIPNKYGGRENLEAIDFLRRFNEVVYAEYPDVQTIAEESTSWPMVSRPLYVGGLGFGMKWDMGWMHDTLAYMGHDPVFRKFHHNEVTFRMMYAFSENFVLALSHDEVVHGKRSLLGRMPGDAWQKLANLRLLYAYQWAQSGKKLLFMGGELAQGQEWSHERSLDWHLLGIEGHAGVRTWVEDLNRLMRENPALHVRDFEPAGFEWIDANDAEASVLSFLRKGREGDPEILVVLNFTPVARPNYRVGVPRGGFWREVLNSDAQRYGGSGWGNLGGQEAAPVGAHGRLHSLSLTLPPLGALFFRHEPAGER